MNKNQKFFIFLFIMLFFFSCAEEEAQNVVDINIKPSFIGEGQTNNAIKNNATNDLIKEYLGLPFNHSMQEMSGKYLKQLLKQKKFQANYESIFQKIAKDSYEEDIAVFTNYSTEDALLLKKNTILLPNADGINIKLNELPEDQRYTSKTLVEKYDHVDEAGNTTLKPSEAKDETYKAFVLISDKIEITEDIETNGQSLVLIANEIISNNKTIRTTPLNDNEGCHLEWKSKCSETGENGSHAGDVIVITNILTGRINVEANGRQGGHGKDGTQATFKASKIANINNYVITECSDDLYDIPDNTRAGDGGDGGDGGNFYLFYHYLNKDMNPIKSEKECYDSNCEDLGCFEAYNTYCRGTKYKNGISRITSFNPDATGILESTNKQCQDELDNDFDGKTDCEDPECYYSPFVDVCDDDGEKTFIQCTDGIDNDQDGLTDCEEPKCKNNPYVLVCEYHNFLKESSNETCTDGENNDNDEIGYTDCDDFGCQNNPNVTECLCNDAPEYSWRYDICKNIPDGEIINISSLENSIEKCTDGMDNDGDGKADCSDPHCYKNYFFGKRLCNNQIHTEEIDETPEALYELRCTQPHQTCEQDFISFSTLSGKSGVAGRSGRAIYVTEKTKKLVGTTINGVWGERWIDYYKKKICVEGAEDAKNGKRGNAGKLVHKKIDISEVNKMLLFFNPYYFKTKIIFGNILFRANKKTDAQFQYLNAIQKLSLIHDYDCSKMQFENFPCDEVDEKICEENYNNYLLEQANYCNLLSESKLKLGYLISGATEKGIFFEERITPSTSLINLLNEFKEEQDSYEHARILHEIYTNRITNDFQLETEKSSMSELIKVSNQDINIVTEELEKLNNEKNKLQEIINKIDSEVIENNERISFLSEEIASKYPSEITLKSLIFALGKDALSIIAKNVAGQIWDKINISENKLYKNFYNLNKSKINKILEENGLNADLTSVNSLMNKIKKGINILMDSNSIDFIVNPSDTTKAIGFIFKELKEGGIDSPLIQKFLKETNLQGNELQAFKELNVVEDDFHNWCTLELIKGFKEGLKKGLIDSKEAVKKTTQATSKDVVANIYNSLQNHTSENLSTNRNLIVDELEQIIVNQKQKDLLINYLDQQLKLENVNYNIKIKRLELQKSKLRKASLKKQINDIDNYTKFCSGSEDNTGCTTKFETNFLYRANVMSMIKILDRLPEAYFKIVNHALWKVLPYDTQTGENIFFTEYITSPPNFNLMDKDRDKTLIEQMNAIKDLVDTYDVEAPASSAYSYERVYIRFFKEDVITNISEKDTSIIKDLGFTEEAKRFYMLKFKLTKNMIKGLSFKTMNLHSIRGLGIRFLVSDEGVELPEMSVFKDPIDTFLVREGKDFVETVNFTINNDLSVNIKPHITYIECDAKDKECSEGYSDTNKQGFSYEDTLQIGYLRNRSLIGDYYIIWEHTDYPTLTLDNLEGIEVAFKVRGFKEKDQVLYPICGNGQVEKMMYTGDNDDNTEREFEECEGDEIKSCSEIGDSYIQGTAKCNPWLCRWNTQDCRINICGNNIIESNEDCETGQTISCTELDTFGVSYSAGEATCHPESCTWDTTNCTIGVCGNNIIESNEDCETGQTISCVELDTSSIPYSSGEAICHTESCTWDTSNCTIGICGNGIIEGKEACEGSKTKDCTTLEGNFISGQLTCNTDSCTWNTDNCETAKDLQYLSPNRKYKSEGSAKGKLHEIIYNDINLDRTSFYCNCSYDEDKYLDLEGCGYQKKNPSSSSADKIQWEHVVTASLMGQTFPAYTQGHPDCITTAGKTYKGRKCAQKVNLEYKYMTTDMYNLYPAVGEVNLARSNKEMSIIKGEERLFGACDFEINSNYAEPREDIRGDIARTYFYMNAAYPNRIILPEENWSVFEQWNLDDPISREECKRAQAIKAFQGNINYFLDQPCSRLFGL